MNKREVLELLHKLLDSATHGELAAIDGQVLMSEIRSELAEMPDDAKIIAKCSVCGKEFESGTCCDHCQYVITALNPNYSSAGD